MLLFAISVPEKSICISRFFERSLQLFPLLVPISDKLVESD